MTIKHLALAVAALVLAGCATSGPPVEPADEAALRITLPDGRVAQWAAVSEAAEERKGITLRKIFTFGSKEKCDSGDVFEGVKRADAKTGLAEPLVGDRHFASILKLRQFADRTLGSLRGQLGSSSPRHESERRNVSVFGELIAVSKEPDCDFHLIMADRNCNSEACRMTMEVSGLPEDDSHVDYDVLVDVRAAFLEALNREPSGSWYRPAEAGTPVFLCVWGSLFFDVDHAAGAAGPRDVAPQTVWEVHPIGALAYVSSRTECPGAVE